MTDQVRPTPDLFPVHQVVPKFCTQIVSVSYVRQFFVMPPLICITELANRSCLDVAQPCLEGSLMAGSACQIIADGASPGDSTQISVMLRVGYKNELFIQLLDLILRIAIFRAPDGAALDPEDLFRIRYFYY